MDTTKIAGLTTAVAGLALLVLTGVMAVAGPGVGVGIGSGYVGNGGNVSMMGQGTQMMGQATQMMGQATQIMGQGTQMMGQGTQMMGGYASGGTAGAAAIPGATEVTVTAADLTFSPTELRLPAGRDVNLTLVNRGQVLHDLTIPALSVHIVAGPGESRTVGLRNLTPGRYEGFCSVPGHAQAGMRVTVVLE